MGMRKKRETKIGEEGEEEEEKEEGGERFESKPIRFERDGRSDANRRKTSALDCSE